MLVASCRRLSSSLGRDRGLSGPRKALRISGKEKEAYLDVVSLNEDTVLPEETVSDKPLVWIDNAD